MKPTKFWQKTDPGLRSHPAFLDLIEELGTSPLMADGLLHGLWSMAFHDAPDGDLTRFKPRALARAIGWPHNGEKMIEALVSAGFLERVTVTDGTQKLVIHDWYDWGGALFRQRDEIRERVSRFREKPANDDNGNRYVTLGNRYPRAKIENEIKERALSAEKISAPSENEWSRRADVVLSATSFRQEYEDLAGMLAAINKTGKVALSRVVRELYEPLLAIENNGTTPASFEYGLRAALGKGAPNPNYVKKAAVNYDPSRVRVEPKQKKTIYCPKDGVEMVPDGDGSPNLHCPVCA